MSPRRGMVLRRNCMNCVPEVQADKNKWLLGQISFCYLSFFFVSVVKFDGSWRNRIVYLSNIENDDVISEYFHRQGDLWQQHICGFAACVLPELLTTLVDQAITQTAMSHLCQMSLQSRELVCLLKDINTSQTHSALWQVKELDKISRL